MVMLKTQPNLVVNRDASFVSLLPQRYLQLLPRGRCKGKYQGAENEPVDSAPEEGTAIVFGGPGIKSFNKAATGVWRQRLGIPANGKAKTGQDFCHYGSNRINEPVMPQNLSLTGQPFVTAQVQGQILELWEANN